MCLCRQMQEVLTCPCCLSIFRQPIALPCGHNLCRTGLHDSLVVQHRPTYNAMHPGGCYIQVFSQPASSRRCPLCRTESWVGDLRSDLGVGGSNFHRQDLPRFELRVNVALAAVSDSLRAFQTIRRHAGPGKCQEPCITGLWWPCVPGRIHGQMQVIVVQTSQKKHRVCFRFLDIHKTVVLLFNNSVQWSKER